MSAYDLIPTDWGTLIPRMKKSVIDHGPQILTGVGIAAMIGGTIVAVKNTPAACEAFDEEREEQGVEQLSLVDILRVGIKYYVVPAGLTIFGSVCIISGIKVSEGRKDAFAALAASEALRLQEYRETVKEKAGNKKAQEIDNEMARKDIEKNGGVPDISAIEESGHGEQIVHWETLGRWFKCDIGWIRRVVNELNAEIDAGDVNEHDPYDTKSLQGVSLNKFLGGIGIEKCDLGMMLGWNGKNRLNPVFVDIVTGKEAEKAVVLEMNMDSCMPMPKWDTVRQDRPQYLAPF